MKKDNIQKTVFFPTIILIVLTACCMMLFPERSAEVVGTLFHILTFDLGWAVLLIFVISCGFGIWLALGRYGSTVLGEKGKTQEYSEFSWASMVFTSGLGVGIVLMAFVEPIAFLSSPPFHVEPLSDQAYEYAHMYSQFLWGIPGWLAYTPAIIAVSYFLYNRKAKVMRLSAVTEPVLGRYSGGVWGNLIDIIVTAGTIGGVATSLGLGVPTVTGILTALMGWEESLGLTFAILAVWTVFFACTVYLGLDKGVRIVSNFNICLFCFFAFVVALKSPLTDIINLELNSFALIIDHLGSLLLATDPITKSGFPQNWTVFYWAWMMSFLPMMALFVGRISRGRTIRKTVVGVSIWGGLGCMISFGLFGGYALYLQHGGTIDLVSVYREQGRTALIMRILKTLPMPGVIMVVYVILLFLFLATTVNSTVFSVASICSEELDGEEQPARWQRVLWAVVLSVFAFALILVGGLETVQTAALFVAVPLIFVLTAVMLSMKKVLKQDLSEEGEERWKKD